MACLDRCVGALAILLVASTPPFQSSTRSSTPTAMLGRVVEGLTEVGVADALVTVRGLAEPYLKLSALSDANGDFVFLDLPEGQYELTASKTGFWFGEYGQRRGGGRGRTYVVAGGQRDAAVRVPVWKSAAVSGTVVDDAGEPVVGLTVQAMGLSPSGGRMLIWNAAREARTDDRGMYRIFGLSPGDYVVSIPAAELASAAPRASRTLDPAGDLAYPLAFHPGGVTAGTDSVMTLAPGEERRGIDFRLQLARTRRVSGRVIGSPDPGGLAVRLTVRTAAFLEDPVFAETTTKADGAFVFDRVVPGDYVIRVFEASAESGGGGASPFRAVGAPTVSRQPSRAGSTGWWAETAVSVTDANLDNVSIELRPTLRISGEVVFAGTAPKPRLNEVAIRLSPAPASGGRVSGIGRTELDDAWRFRTADVPAGQYFLRWPPGLSSGWYIESITLDGREAFDQPVTLRDRDVSGVVITLTDKDSEIAGTVRTESGAIDLDAAVIVFPADSAKRIDFGRDSPRLRDGRVGLDGRYSVRGLPSGEYLAVAVNDAYAENWQTQAFLERVSRGATKLTVAIGATQTVDLRTIQIR